MKSGALALLVAACGARTELAGTPIGADASAPACHDEVIATDLEGASALALDGDVVLWGTQDGLVRMRDAAGVTKTLAAENEAIASIAVGVVDPDNVYYAITGSIRRVSRTTGIVEDVATNAGIPFDLAFGTASITSTARGSPLDPCTRSSASRTSRSSTASTRQAGCPSTTSTSSPPPSSRRRTTRA